MYVTSRMSRAPRTTKTQKAFIVDFLESNQILLGGTNDPLQQPSIDQLWEKLASELNVVGPPKTVRGWKDAIGEIKTRVRRHAKEVRYGHQVTRSGATVKPLTYLEMRLLAILEGATLSDEKDVSVNFFEAEEISVNTMDPSPRSVDDELSESVPSNKPKIIYTESKYVPDIESSATIPLNTPVDAGTDEGINHALGTSRRDIRRINNTRAKRRIVSAIANHSKQLGNLAKSNYAIARALTNLARSISSRRDT